MPRKIVYHGTYSEKPPHLYDQPTFHAGDEKTALSRLANVSDWSGTSRGRIPAGSEGTVHAYEVSETAPMSRRVWNDPMDDNPAPEENTKRIYRYKNIGERGKDVSMVIPTKFVGEHVKYLGTQFTGYKPANPWWKEDGE